MKHNYEHSKEANAKVHVAGLDGRSQAGAPGADECESKREKSCRVSRDSYLPCEAGVYHS